MRCMSASETKRNACSVGSPAAASNSDLGHQSREVISAQ